MDNENILVIGLDFGTTYSGVAYCQTNEKDRAKAANLVQIITAWPGQGNSNNEKVPSRICYSEKPPKIEIKWGNEIKPNQKGRVYALMKLKLDERLKKSSQLKLLLALLSSNLEGLNLDSDDEDGPPEYPGKAPVEIVSDYLTAVRKFVWEELGNIFDPGLFKSLRKELVVTVPAVWSERAKDLTLKAVHKADFMTNEIMLVTEPEAAAIYTLKTMLEGANRNALKVSDHFVLCDAGGGTVDLISYKITQMEPVVKVEEAAIGSGDKCGASYIDKEFLVWLEKWIGSEAYAKIPQDRTRHGSPFMSNFENAKFHFDGDDEVVLTLPPECGIIDDDDKDICGGMLTISPDQMRNIFDPCVNRTLELIDGQVASIMERGKSKPKMVLVVGGFGKNKYLYKKIQEYCQERKIGTLRPTFPWSAVARGAVCRGLEGPQSGLVAVRLARKHYGTPICEPFVPGYHDERDAYIDEFTGRKYARGQMRWLIDKGERLPEAEPKGASIGCCAEFKKTDDLTFGAVLVGADDNIPPTRYRDTKTYNICKVTANLDAVPESKFVKCRSGLGGEEYFVAEFTLEATMLGAEIKWAFIFDGKLYSSVTVDYSK